MDELLHEPEPAGIRTRPALPTMSVALPALLVFDQTLSLIFLLDLWLNGTASLWEAD